MEAGARRRRARPLRMSWSAWCAPDATAVMNSRSGTCSDETEDHILVEVDDDLYDGRVPDPEDRAHKPLDIGHID